METSARRQSLLRRSSPADDVRVEAIRLDRVRVTTRHVEHNTEERGHGGAVVSSGHGELMLRRGDSHGDDDGIGNKALT